MPVCETVPMQSPPPPGPDAPAGGARNGGDRLAWTREGTYQVAPGVYRIPLPLPFDGLRAVNVYAIESSDGLTLIDSGWVQAATRDLLERSLRSIGAGFGDIRRFLITHLHRDHYTQAIALREVFGTPVALGAEEKASLDALLSKQFRLLSAQADRLATAGAEELLRKLERAGLNRTQEVLDYAEPDEWIGAGQAFDLGDRTLEAIATPGHTRGHLVFTDRAAGLLFAGDHVLPHITPSIGFEAVPPPLPLRDYLESLRLVRRMPDLALLPAHGPVGPSVHARVDELLDHHEGRLAAMTRRLADGVRTAYQVAGELRWTSRDRRLTELDPLNQVLAVCETECHLDLLVSRGLATARIAEGVRRYQLIAA
jgi:glyoxylase-like metal-dependent hydrolase (beta-lactamase superfamily II)